MVGQLFVLHSIVIPGNKIKQAKYMPGTARKGRHHGTRGEARQDKAIVVVVVVDAVLFVVKCAVPSPTADRPRAFPTMLHPLTRTIGI